MYRPWDKKALRKRTEGRLRYPALVKRTAFYFFRYRSPTTGRWVKSRHRAKLEDIPAGAEPITDTVEWRELPATPEEARALCTGAWQRGKHEPRG